MTERSSSQGPPDGWNRDGYVTGEHYHNAGAGQNPEAGQNYGAGGPQYGTAGGQQYGVGSEPYGVGRVNPAVPNPGAEAPTTAIRPPAQGQGADAKGFLASLFDFSFTSFVTPKIIKVLYILILVITILSALAYTAFAFKLNVAFGVLTLIIGDPLYIIIVLAFWRLVLEFFIVAFRIAEDIRALRERSGFR